MSRTPDGDCLVTLQVWDFWTQVSQCLNISANSMVASALGEVCF